MIKKKGFTLIETLIYAALIAVIIGFILGGVFQIIESSNQINKKSAIEEEANFLLRKIEWGLTGASTINSPPAGASSTMLSLNKSNFSNNPIVFSLNSGNLTIKKGSGSEVILNSERVKLENINFEHLPLSQNKPEGVKINLTLKGESNNLSTYNLTIYLRK